MLPGFLIIGAPRSGTTWLAKNLMEHPQIFLPSCKEVHFFDRNYDKGLPWYEDFFESARDVQTIGEATPAYLANKASAARIERDLGDIKLIAVLRDPVDRLYSRHCNAIGKHKDQRTITFEDRIARNQTFVEEGYYFEHISRYLDVFPRKSLNVSFYDDLKRSPVKFLRDIFKFLGVDENVDTLASSHILNAAAAKPLNATSSWLYYAQRAARKAGLVSVADRIDQLNRREMPELDSNTRRKLIAETYGARNDNLARLLNVDLSHWNSCQN